MNKAYGLLEQCVYVLRTLIEGGTIEREPVVRLANEITAALESPGREVSAGELEQTLTRMFALMKKQGLDKTPGNSPD